MAALLRIYYALYEFVWFPILKSVRSEGIQVLTKC